MVDLIASKISGICTLSNILVFVTPLDGDTATRSSKKAAEPIFPHIPVTVQIGVAVKVSRLKMFPGIPLFRAYQESVPPTAIKVTANFERTKSSFASKDWYISPEKAFIPRI